MGYGLAVYCECGAQGSVGINKEEALARLDFDLVGKLYISQVKSGKVSTQEKSEAIAKLKITQQHLKLLNFTFKKQRWI